METRSLICSPNQRTGFCMIGTFVMKELNDVILESFMIELKFFLNFLESSSCKQTFKTLSSIYDDDF